jgi:hypothetical protein
LKGPVRNGLNDGFSTYLEREVLHIILNILVVKGTTHKSLCVKDGVVGIHWCLILGSVSDKTLTFGSKRNIRGGDTVTLED